MRRMLVGGIMVLALGGILFLACRRPPVESKNEAEFVRLMNAGMGRIENRESDNAVKTLTQAVAMRPQSAAALRNLARAHLITKDAAAAKQAAEALDHALKIEPESVASHYLMGLALNRMEQFERAVTFLERAVQLDPVTPALRYQLGRTYEYVNKHDRAREQFQETIRLDPLNTAAYYRLAAHARQNRDRDEVIRLTNEFQRLKDMFPLQPEDILERCAHTAPEPGTSPAAPAGDSPAPTPVPIRWTDATADIFKGDDSIASVAAVIDVDRAGRPTIFAAAPNGELALLSLSPNGTMTRRVVRSAGAASPKFTHCAVGDFFIRITRANKTTPKTGVRNDVLLIGPDGALLLERTGDETFEDRNAAVVLSGLSGRCAQWCDYDHNGVLDLLVAGDAGLQLWQNNSYVIRFDATTGIEPEAADARPRFENVTESAGITPTGPVRDIAAVDLDGNGGIDVVAACDDDATRVFMNQRAGRFVPMASPPGPWPAAMRVLVNDFDNDGHADIVLVNADHALVLYNAGANRSRLDFPGMSAVGGAIVDGDNDGFLDFFVVGRRSDDPAAGALRYWRNAGDGIILDVTSESGTDALRLPPVRDAFAADFDVDGDTDVMLIGDDDRLRLLRNDGGNANRQLKLRLVTILTNSTGLGSRIELRDGARWVSRFVTGVPIEIGVGESTRLDTVHVLWTNGVVDNEFLVSPTNEPIEYVEKMVELGSCPFLYAWDGNHFRFVTDILGNAPVGLSLRRDIMLPSDPEEIVLVGDAGGFPQRDGYYDLETAECYREVLYLDDADLIAVDHAPGVEVHPTDKLMPPPFPPSELWAVADPRPPLSVESDDGIDRAAALQSIDGDYAPPGESLPAPFRGLCHPLTLTMDFGPLESDVSLVLALTGWLRYGSASVNIAVEQNPGVTIIPPRLDCETTDGQWRPVDVVVGMPAGKTKTILVDLTGTLAPDARRLRLTSTFEIRWDRIALARRVNMPEQNVQVVSPAHADLHWRGFPEMKSLAPNHPITPDTRHMTDRPQWRTLPGGWCTRYGNVLELLAVRDDLFVIINSGDAVSLRFPAAAFTPIPDGLTRTFFFRSVGWEKDADYNVITGDEVDPIPSSYAPDPIGAAADEIPAWQIKYNTRWVPRESYPVPR